MDFSLSEEQLDVKNLAAQILAQESGTDRLRELELSGLQFDESLWQQLAQSGLLGLAIEEGLGGMGYDFETLCLLVEEVGKTVAAVPAVPVLVSAALTLQAAGSASQKKAWLPGIADGSALLSAALVEPGSDDPLLPTCRLERQGDIQRLSGSKHMVVLASRADRVMLGAQAEDGLALLLVDPKAPGVRLTEQYSTTGEPQFEISFDNVTVNDDDVLATGAEALKAITLMRQYTLAAQSVMILGVLQTMLEMTASYTAEREQFGRPVATFQAVSHRAADAFIDIENLRLACELAVSRLSNGEEASEAVNIAKIWSCDVAHRVSQSSQHLHGGIGIDKDYPLFRYCLWAKQLELSLGGAGVYLAALGDAIAEEFKQQPADLSELTDSAA